MKPEYLEPWKQIHPTKNELLLAWSNWFESKSNEWSLFAITVVFKAGGRLPKPERWESEYKNRVLLKIRRALERNENNFGTAIPFDSFCYYEFDETSMFRNGSLRKPHHIHALIPIRKSAVHRFWSLDEYNLNNRIKKDIYSIDSVGSVLVEPIKVIGSLDWIGYCLKGKSI